MSHSNCRKALLYLVIACLWVAAYEFTFSGTAHADEKEAKRHFKSGKKLLKAERYPDACKEFDTSNKLFPNLGALHNVGICNLRQGNLNEAWNAFDAAVEFGKKKNDPRWELAIAERDKLRTKVGLLELVVEKDLVQASGFSLTLDGNPVGREQINRARAVPFGRRRIIAQADGYRRYVYDIDIGDSARTKIIALPVSPEKKSRGSTDLAASDAPADTSESSDDGLDRSSSDGGLGDVSIAAPSNSTMSGQRRLALGLWAGSAVAIGAGTYFGLSARSRWKDAKECRTIGPCTDDDVALGDQASLRGNIATGTFAVGIALAALGTWLFLTDPKSRTTSKVLAIGLGEISYMTRF